MKNIVILGPAYPYRGGIANFNEMLARTYARRGDKVMVETFTVQYPKLLFPGKTQYSQSPAPADINIRRSVNSVNPLNWLRVGSRIGKSRPDMLLLKYWTPFMAPCLGTIARRVRANGHTAVVVQVDNIVPHEHHFTDRPFNKYFIDSVDGFVYMSQQVKNDLDSFGRNHPALFSPHPIFEVFGDPVSRPEACKALGLDPQLHYSLFFGIVRDYKGLDILLDAWKIFKGHGGAGDKKLIVAGEFYYNKEAYLDQIDRNGLTEDVVVHDRFIPDELVKNYFSAVDVLIQPYKSATQSGVTQIAYNFEVPMIVTDVGGLSEIVTHGVGGYVVHPDAVSVAEAITRFYTTGHAASLRRNMAAEKNRFTWDAMCDQLDQVYDQVRSSK